MSSGLNGSVSGDERLTHSSASPAAASSQPSHMKRSLSSSSHPSSAPIPIPSSSSSSSVSHSSKLPPIPSSSPTSTASSLASTPTSSFNSPTNHQRSESQSGTPNEGIKSKLLSHVENRPDREQLMKRNIIKGHYYLRTHTNGNQIAILFYCDWLPCMVLTIFRPLLCSSCHRFHPV